MTLADRLKGVKRPKWKPRPELLLCGNVPNPMHGRAPRVVLGSKWWEQTRQAAYRSTAFHCAACGVWKHQAKGRKWLEAHEVYEIDYLRGRMTYVETVPLCHYCHAYIHSGRLAAMLEEGWISQGRYAAIVRHGDLVLAEAGLEQPVPYTGPMAEWSDWRLVIDGVEYPPKHKNANAWRRAYDKKPRRKK